LRQHEERGNKMAESTPEEFDALMEKMSRVQDQIDATNAWELDRQLEIAMDAMRLPPGDFQAETLSGGERRRVALCKTLLRKPDQRELEWAKMAPKARTTKSKARLSAYEKLAAQEYEEREDELQIQIPPGPHLGDLVVRADGLKKAYGDNLLFENMSFDLLRGGLVG